MAGGDISSEFTVWCSDCAAWHQEGYWRLPDFRASIRSIGWRMREKAWVCPDCLRRRTAKSAAKSRERERLRQRRLKKKVMAFNVPKGPDSWVATASKVEPHPSDGKATESTVEPQVDEAVESPVEPPKAWWQHV